MLAQREQRQGLRAGSLLARLGVSLPAGLLIVAWVLLMISVPIINWTLGQSAMRQMLVVSVVAQATSLDRQAGGASGHLPALPSANGAES